MGSRLALPQNYIKDAGTVWQDMQDDGNWGGAHTPDLVNFKNGDHSIKWSTSSAVLVAKDVGGVDLSTVSMFSFWAYCHTEPIETLLQLHIIISSTANYTKYFRYTVNGQNLAVGWNLLSVHKEDMDNVNDDSWDNSMLLVGFNITPVTGQTAIVSIGGVNQELRQIPKVLLTFDDGNEENISDNVFTYMGDRGLKGTSFITSSWVGTATFMTEANLDTLYAAGWAMANHSVTHPDFTGLTQAGVESEISVCRDWLLARGYDRSANHLAYPFGLRNNMVSDACIAQGVLTGRVAATDSFTPGADNLLVLAADYVLNTETLADIIDHVDTALRSGKTIIVVFHRIKDTPTETSDWSTVKFQGLIDHLLTRKVSCVTVDEWYEGLTNPRYRSIPLTRVSV